MPVAVGRECLSRLLGSMVCWSALVQHGSELSKGHHLLSSFPCSGQEGGLSKRRSSSSTGVGQVGDKTLVLCWAFSFPFPSSLKAQLPCQQLGVALCSDGVLAPCSTYVRPITLRDATLQIVRSYSIDIFPLVLLLPLLFGGRRERLAPGRPFLSCAGSSPLRCDASFIARLICCVLFLSVWVILCLPCRIAKC